MPLIPLFFGGSKILVCTPRRFSGNAQAQVTGTDLRICKHALITAFKSAPMQDVSSPQTVIFAIEDLVRSRYTILKSTAVGAGFVRLQYCALTSQLIRA